MIRKVILGICAIIGITSHVYSMHEAPSHNEPTKEPVTEPVKEPPVVPVKPQEGPKQTTHEPQKGGRGVSQPGQPEQRDGSTIVTVTPEQGPQVSIIPIQEPSDPVNMLKEASNNLDAINPDIFTKAIDAAPKTAAEQITFNTLSRLSKSRLDAIVSGIKLAFSTTVTEAASAAIDLLNKSFTAFKNALASGANTVAARLGDFQSNLIALFEPFIIDELEDESPELVDQFTRGVSDSDIYAQQNTAAQLTYALIELGFYSNPLMTEPDLRKGYDDKVNSLNIALGNTSISAVKRLYTEKLNALHRDYNRIAQARGFQAI